MLKMGSTSGSALASGKLWPDSRCILVDARAEAAVTGLADVVEILVQRRDLHQTHLPNFDALYGAAGEQLPDALQVVARIKGPPFYQKFHFLLRCSFFSVQFN